MAVPGRRDESIHEVDFCGVIASAANVLFTADPAAYPFADARVEGFGKGAAHRKRKDLRFYEPGNKLALCGEVKLPGTVEGRSPFDEGLCQDAFQKADNAAVRFFFTWNVNVFVLWDRSQWEKPLLERRVRDWKLGLTLGSAEEVARPENLEFIKTRFLPELLRDLADIYTGRRRDWTMPPDDIFIRSLESHLDWPVQLTTAYLIDRTGRNKKFDNDVQWWLTDQDWLFVRNDPDEWRDALGNMAKTLAYVWANRLIFYKALRARFPELPRLVLKRSVKTSDAAVSAFHRYFRKAVDQSGDYEPLLFPNTEDWATELVFQAPNALDAWRGLLRGIESVDFKDVPSDIVGRIFQKLIGPEERHRYGQHFTGDDVVDLINAFCIHKAADSVLDPACGSGSFLVRAYYRKRQLDPARDHAQQLADLFGCDIALYPAHLATLNLAAREINDEANYPRIVRQDFFDVEPKGPFCTIPDDAGGTIPVKLPRLAAVVGNPPYVRQEKIDKDDKAAYASRAAAAWADLKLSGRADLHCYFWPVATKLLTPGGFFGFLTSSSWLDVEYGFALQGWILQHFKLLAVMESAAEPWFPDARVKTAVTILQRCEDEAERMGNLVRFVRFDRPLKAIIGTAAGEDESGRQASVERLRDRILSATREFEDNDLWNDGVRAGTALREANVEAEDADTDDDSDEDDGRWSERKSNESGTLLRCSEGDYVAGKWGRYVRAPDFYFEIMRRFGSRFVPLGEIATIRRGITSGCDAFFMPRDVTERLLREYDTDSAFRRRSGGAPRKDVVSGKLRIIEAGDGSVHPIEADFLAPEVHSLMKVDRPVVRAKDLDRVVLLVGQPMKDLRGTWVYRYLKYGEQATFASRKSKAGPIPQRSTCAARDPWYDLTKLVKPGIAFWAKSQHYRHIVPANPKRIVCNCNLYDVASDVLTSGEQRALVAILNSTLIGLFKTFYGRFAGTEGNLKTEVVDVNLLDVPDPRGVDAALAARLTTAVKGMCRRSVGRLVEQQLMDCHSPERGRRIAAGPLVFSGELLQPDRRALDDAVFELIGVTDRGERFQLMQLLHEATARHFRHIRAVEIEKQEQRARTANRRFTAQELASDAWHAAELEDATPLTEWLSRQPDCTAAVNIPDERPAQLSHSPMFDPNTIYFGKKRDAHVDCESEGQAKLLVYLANLGISGWVHTPTDEAGCAELLNAARMRMAAAERRFAELAESRTSDPRLQAQIIEQLVRWYVHGRERKEQATEAPSG
jgi:methylase of polypeptide subunit release factors